jgi:cobalt/nickel transport system ATP-binding protein
MSDPDVLPDRNALDVEGLAFTYPEGVNALVGVRFTLADDECAALVGPNGAGKTTLFLCLTGVLRGQADRLCVAGLDPRDPRQRRRLFARVGLLFQDSDDQLFSPTLLDDVAFGPLNLGIEPEAARRLALAAIERVGLSGRESRSPLHLSGGEKRRAALAGLLAMQPRVLLLDEPTQFLDPRGRRELIALIAGLPGAKLIASHDLEMILELCPRTLLLDGGRLIADGPSPRLLASRELMEAHGLEVPWSLRLGIGQVPSSP